MAEAATRVAGGGLSLASAPASARVPSTRLALISALYLAVQRWSAIPAPGQVHARAEPVEFAGPARRVGDQPGVGCTRVPADLVGGPRGPPDEPDHLVAVGAQAGHERGADQAGRTGDRDLHGLRCTLVTVARG